MLIGKYKSRTSNEGRPIGSGSARERLLGLAAVKEYNGAADLAVVTEPGLVNPMSDLTEDFKRGQTDTC